VDTGNATGAEHAQHLGYGTAECSRIYLRLRNAVEGTNGYIKGPTHEVAEADATRRIRGIAPQAILLASNSPTPTSARSRTGSARYRANTANPPNAARPDVARPDPSAAGHQQAT
jgi:hypothetical protein